MPWTGIEPVTRGFSVLCSTNWATKACLIVTVNTWNYECRRPESNRHGRLVPQDFKSCASASSATAAYPFSGSGWRWIRTTESTANRFTVCPLWPLGKSSMFGAGNRTRTYNLLITSQLLYQLSHTSLLRGYVLLSQAVAHQVPSALKSLTSVFGMGTGVSSLL